MVGTKVSSAACFGFCSSSSSLFDTFPAFALWLHRVAGARRDGTERNGAGTKRSSSLSNTFPAFALSLHRVAGVGRKEQNGTGPTRAAAATGSTLTATAMREGPGGEGGTVCYYLLLLFLYFHLCFISLFFFFSDHFFFRQVQQ